MNWIILTLTAAVFIVAMLRLAYEIKAWWDRFSLFDSLFDRIFFPIVYTVCVGWMGWMVKIFYDVVAKNWSAF